MEKTLDASALRKGMSTEYIVCMLQEDITADIT